MERQFWTLEQDDKTCPTRKIHAGAELGLALLKDPSYAHRRPRCGARKPRLMIARGYCAEAPEAVRWRKRDSAAAAARVRLSSNWRKPPKARNEDAATGLDPVRYGDWEVKGIATDF